MSKKSFIVRGPKRGSDVNDETLGEFFLTHLKKRCANEIITIDAITKEVQTCGDLLRDAAKAVTLFKNRGLQEGDVISIVSENIPRLNVPLLAAWCMGITVNLLNPDYTIGEFRHGLLPCKPKLILSSSKALENLNALKKELEFVDEVMLIDDTDQETDNANFNTLLKAMQIDALEPEPERFEPSKNYCLILLSSGTTGLPKSVPLTHRNARHFFACYTDEKYVGVKPKDTMLLILPVFHIFGLFIYCGSMFVPEVKIIVVRKFMPDLFLSSIQESKVTKLQVVPTLMLFLAKSPLTQKYDLSSVEDILCGAAYVGKEIIDEVSKRIGTTSIRQVYGLTETGGPCIMTPSNAETSTIGKLVPEFRAKVRDPTTGKVNGPGKPGELCFKGPSIMERYLNIKSDNTVFDEEGFYRTGDIGFYDEEGYFYIVGRIKDVIKYKGFQVSPTEIESILLMHPGVKDCCVVGKPDERSGHLPFAFVVSQIGAEVTEQELVDYVAERISTSKRLYGGVRFIEEIPKNASGKPLRRNLEELLVSGLL